MNFRRFEIKEDDQYELSWLSDLLKGLDKNTKQNILRQCVKTNDAHYQKK